MLKAINEYPSFPSFPEQYDIFYHIVNDKLYLQTLPDTDVSYPSWVEIDTGASLRSSQVRDKSLTTSEYVAKDFYTYLNEMLAYIKKNWGSEFDNFQSSDPIMMIAEYIAAALDQLSWYMDRECDEHFLATARTRSSVALLANQLGYKPRPSVAASATLSVTLTNGPYGFDVTIPEGHKFQGPNGLIFESNGDYTVFAGDTEIEIGVFQGQTFEEAFVSSGAANQEFRLSLIPDGHLLAKDKTKVFVNLIEWTEYDFIPYEDAQAFSVTSLTVPPRLKFGDGIIGRIPVQGSDIRVSYVATKGGSSGFAKAETITESIDTLVVNFTQIPLTVINNSSATGGSDAESIDSIRVNAPSSFIAADRLVTESDYNTLAGTYSGVSGSVSKAKASVIRGVADDLELQSLMDALTSDRSTLQNYLDLITGYAQSVSSRVGSVSNEDTAKYILNELTSLNESIRAKVSELSENVISTKAEIENVKDRIEDAQLRLEFIPFKEVIGYGDSTTKVFSFSLSMSDVKEGSVTVFLENKDPDISLTDGNCDATPGFLQTSTSVDLSYIGKMIRIGAEHRQIVSIDNSGTTKIRYSGPRIYGTSLLVDIYPGTVFAYSDEDGNFTGNGIVGGDVNYSIGQITNLEFGVAPGGISGEYGVPIRVTYQYKRSSVVGVLDDALSYCDSTSDLVDVFSIQGGEVSDFSTSSDESIGSLDTDVLDEINSDCTNIVTTSYNASIVPVTIENDISELSDYLEEILSGDCKANIVRVSVLTKDENGFYSSPSVSLVSDLKSYLDDRKIRSVVNSVVDGAYYLVKVKLNIAISVNKPYKFDTVKQRILSNLDVMFKDREYGGHLMRSEYYNVIHDTIGVNYCNVSISDTAYSNSNNTDTPPSVDSDGNLFIADHEVVTKWSVTVAEIV